MATGLADQARRSGNGSELPASKAAPGGVVAPTEGLTTRRNTLLMADQNPMGAKRPVPLNLPACQVAILRESLRMWLGGVREDLKTPERLRDPDKRRREAAAYERLLTGIGWGTVIVPDEEARAFLASAAKGNDAGNEYAQAKAEHDALHGLLSVLQGRAD